MGSVFVGGGPLAVNGAGGVVTLKHVDGDAVYIGSTGQVSALAYDSVLTVGQSIAIGSGTRWMVTARGGRARLSGTVDTRPSNAVRVVGAVTDDQVPTFDADFQVYVPGAGTGGINGTVQASQDFLYDSVHAFIRDGTVIFRYDLDGSPLWCENRLVQDGNLLARDGFTDAGVDQRTGRAIFKSLLLNAFEDPPDVTFARSGATNWEYTGTDGVTGSPNPNSFSAASAVFSSNSEGRGIVLGGVRYLIDEMITATSVTLLDINMVPAVLAPATGVVWQIPRDPYPDSIVGAAGSIGQVRVAPYAAPAIRSGSNAVTNSSATLQLPGGVTTADVNRWVQLAANDDYTYQIVAYVDATHVTLDRVHPVTATGVAYQIAGNLYDGGAARTPLNPGTFGFSAESPPVRFAANRNYAPTNAYLTLQGQENLVDGGGPEYVTVWRGDGRTMAVRLSLAALGSLSPEDSTPPVDCEIWRASDGILETNARLQFSELADPAAPAADKVVMYARDNGSGKTQVVARFATGAIQVVATQP